MKTDKKLIAVTANQSSNQKLSASQTRSSNGKRAFILILSALLIVALPIVVNFVGQNWRKLKLLQSELSTVNKQSSDLAVLQKSINSYKNYHKELKQIMNKAEQSKLGGKNWIKRNVAVNKKQINRTEAAGFLDGAGRGKDSFFKTTMFEIKVVQVGDDLFKFRKGDSDEVQMTMDGVFYTRIKH